MSSNCTLASGANAGEALMVVELALLASLGDVKRRQQCRVSARWAASADGA